MKKKLFPVLFLMFTFIALLLTSVSGCKVNKQEQNNAAVVDDPNQFVVVVAGEQFVGDNSELPQEVADRAPIDAQKASEYLYNFAVATNTISNIATELSKKKTVLNAIMALLPYAISDLPHLIAAWHSLKKFNEFVDATKGLTPAEHAIVVNYFAQKLNLPTEKAEPIAVAAVQAALANVALFTQIKPLVKK